MKDKHYKLLRRLMPFVVIAALCWLIVGNLQAISDYVRLYNYQPPAEIAELAKQTSMTEEGKKLFYVNHPRLADRDSFNGACNNRGEKTIVLGCYHSVDRGIYLFDVEDARLNGVEQVTAAHEMLHAAYDRLSGKERDRINRLLRDYYAQNVQDARIRDTIAAYEKSEPNDIPNEMHSIFATEIAELPPELQVHYNRYFVDRSKVVEFAANYQQEFSARQEQVREYDIRLTSLKDTIDRNTAELARREEEINNMQQQMERDRDSNNVERFNAQVPVFNARVDSYNGLIRATQSSITEYNRLVAERNNLALEIRELTGSISSQFTPIDR